MSIQAGKNLSKMKYNEDVMEVHNEFMTAGETILKKAEEILRTEVKINPAKIERLKSFGFKSSKDATALEDNKAEKTHQQNLIEAINYYRVKFPNYKFIPQDTVKAICEKYGLVSGEAHQYKGFVPEKNLTEIERFFEVHPDTKFTYFKTSTKGGLYSWFTPDAQIEKEEYDEIMAKQLEAKNSVQSFGRGLADKEITGKSIFKHYENPASRPDYFRSWFDNSQNRLFTTSDPNLMEDDYGFIQTGGRRTGMTYLIETYAEMHKQTTDDFFGTRGISDPTDTKKETKLRICAPVSEMITEGYEVEDGYKLVYDPIVSIEVIHKNGIKGEIILTAWGDEASDELVIDQNKN